MIVKQESIIEFFKENVVGCEEDIKNSRCTHHPIAFLMKDELLVRFHDCIDNSVTFEFEEMANVSSQSLKTSIKYSLKAYDDVCSKLIRKSTKIEQA